MLASFARFIYKITFEGVVSKALTPCGAKNNVFAYCTQNQKSSVIAQENKRKSNYSYKNIEHINRKYTSSFDLGKKKLKQASYHILSAIQLTAFRGRQGANYGKGSSLKFAYSSLIYVANKILKALASANVSVAYLSLLFLLLVISGFIFTGQPLQLFRFTPKTLPVFAH